MTCAQPMHMTHILHTWGRVQLWRVAWDSYVWISTFVAQETSNDRFTILEHVLPIASKRRVIHYLESLKRKRKKCSYKLRQTNEGALTSLKVYISVVSIWGSCLKLLWVVLVFHLYLYLLWWGTCLGLTLVYISISTSSTAPACLIPVGYVGEICNDVSAYSIPKGYTHHLDLYRIYAYIFNSYRICA